MTLGSGSRRRDVHARWRLGGLAASSADGGSTDPERERTLDVESAFREAQREWDSTHLPAIGLELVTAGLLLEAPERVEDVASTLASDESLSDEARRVARRALHPNVTISPPIADRRDRIRELRRKMRIDPRNAIVWADLARENASRGRDKDAERALRVAVALAPTNRFVLRSASSFFAHSDREVIALELLARNPRTQFDPWLLAAELAAANAAKCKAPHHRQALRMLEDGDFSTTQLSELASALGTRELGAGGDRRARQFFRRALLSPTENSLAQARWAADSLVGIDPSVQPVDGEPHEAIARWATHDGDWPLAIEAAMRWRGHFPTEPDAIRMALFASTVGLEDFHRSKELAEEGLRVWPDDPSLLNSWAIAMINLGDFKEARATLNRLQSMTMEPELKVCVIATTGLFNYRIGATDEGRHAFERAIALARPIRSDYLHPMALLTQAREEWLRATPEARVLLTRALDAAATSRNSAVAAGHKRLSESAATPRDDSPSLF